jgi:hypothetical protein
MNDENTGFAAFSLYNALHLHFTSSSYDYFKYNGKTNVSKDSFPRRKDKWHFYRLSRKYGIDELRDFYVANFIASDIRWVGDISGPEGEDTYKKWQKRNQSLTYNFEQDIIHLFETENWLKVNNGQYPYLLEETMRKGIEIETLCILNDIMKFFPMWSEKISDDIIWPGYKLKCERYTPFIDYDREKFKTILKEAVKEYA